MAFLFRKKKKTELNIPLPPPPPIRKRFLEEQENETKFPQFPALPDFPEIRPKQEVSATEKIIRKVGHAIPKVKEVHMKPTSPMFISSSDYKKINDDVREIQSKIHEANDCIQNLENLKQEHERVLENWRNHLEDVERKMSKIDDIILKHTKV